MNTTFDIGIQIVGKNGSRIVRKTVDLPFLCTVGMVIEDRAITQEDPYQKVERVICNTDGSVRADLGYYPSEYDDMDKAIGAFQSFGWHTTDSQPR